MLSSRRFAQSIAVAALVGTVAACGGGAGKTPAPPSGAPSTAAARTAPSPPPSAAPTLPAGAGGLTPVFAHGRRDGAKRVALTFDADMTADQDKRAARGERFDNPELIATLRKLDVPATVFMTGKWADQYPDEARSIGGDPLFEVANHSYTHHAFASPCYGLPAVAPGSARDDVERAFAAFKRAGVAHTVPYFRFPGGCYDDAVLRAIAPARVTAVQWDVISGDAFAKKSAPVVEQVLSQVKPGSVVVMHCTRSAAPVTEEAVRKIVPELRARGYTFVRVSDMIAGR
ncbi:polysaccharide deacetylase family protein [Streptomyces olivoreticuli]|uniref:polysaccharide deacetylase family protein n=1 Tax=Streptomyces olivoreticuli TaxID=68246 RepID=UPI002658587B|nr:polysaccharide deacetylase family protein [Streptomyces olivoreticuli]WKK25266.1 polysaccharide deacetylase family protein [Streptomyces olivoreticuli]